MAFCLVGSVDQDITARVSLLGVDEVLYATELCVGPPLFFFFTVDIEEEVSVN